jgi:acyl carrier protein
VSDVSSANDSVTAASVLAIIREELGAIGVDGAELFDPASPWDEIDVDSVEVVELVAALEEQYDVDMAGDDYKELKTADALAQRVSQLAGARAAE